MTGRYVRSTFVEDQREFVEHLQIGKQIGKLLDMPKRPQAQKHIFWVWNMRNLETWFQILKSLKNIIKMLTKILYRMAVTLFQTSSRGSRLKQNRFGRKFKNTVNAQSSFNSGSDFLFQKYLKLVLF